MATVGFLLLSWALMTITPDPRPHQNFLRKVPSCFSLVCLWPISSICSHPAGKGKHSKCLMHILCWYVLTKYGLLFRRHIFLFLSVQLDYVSSISFSIFFPPHSALCFLEMLPCSCVYIWAMPCADHALPIHSASDRYPGHLQLPTHRNNECPCTCPLLNPTGRFFRSRTVGWEGVWTLNMPKIPDGSFSAHTCLHCHQHGGSCVPPPTNTCQSPAHSLFARLKA